MGRITGAWAGVKRHLRARPWTVRAFVALALASPALLLLPGVTLERNGHAVLHLLLVLGVWAGSRFAWGLLLALLSFSFLIGLVAAAEGTGLILVGILAVWIGLLVAAPTYGWVTHGGSRTGSGRMFAIGRRVGRFVRSDWGSRPLTLQVYVGASVALLLLSIAVDPRQLASPWVLVTILSVVVLKLLWDGSAGVWWLFVVLNGAGAALSLGATFRDPSAGLGFAISAAALMLLVHGSTRRWFNQRTAERFP